MSNTSGAGKGDRLRQVARQTYEHNYDAIFSRRKRIKQWRDHFSHNLLDCEGFNGYWFDSLLTEEEYLNCAKACAQELTKTWQDWAKQFGDTILDPDSFDRTDDTKKYTLDEYKAGLIHCTRMLLTK